MSSLLLGEDDCALASMLRDNLTPQGFEVASVPNADDALARV